MSRADALAEGLTSARVRAELDAVAGPPLRPIDYAAAPSDRPDGFGAPLNVPMGPTVSESDDGRLVVEWPAGRPSWFVMTPEALDELVERVGRRARTTERSDDEGTDRG